MEYEINIHPLLSFVLYFCLVIQMMQWASTIYDLDSGHIKKRSIFFIRMIPGYFIILGILWLSETVRYLNSKFED